MFFATPRVKEMLKDQLHPPFLILLYWSGVALFILTMYQATPCVLPYCPFNSILVLAITLLQRLLGSLEGCGLGAGM